MSRWVKKIKKRFGIKSRVLHSECSWIKFDKEEEVRKEIKIANSEYIIRDIFNANKTGLFYKIMLNRKLAIIKESIHEVRKIKTVLQCDYDKLQ